MGGQRVNTRTCAADGENLLVTEVWTDAAGRRMPVQVDLTVPAGTAAVAGTGQVQITRTTGTDTDTGWVSKAAASAKVVGSPTTVTASAPAGTNARLSFDLLPNTPVRIVMSIHGNGGYNNTTALATLTTRRSTGRRN